MERTLVAGASTDEFIIAQILSQLFILVVQVSLMLVVSFGVMGIPSEGPIMLASGMYMYFLNYFLLSKIIMLSLIISLF